MRSRAYLRASGSLTTPVVDPEDSRYVPGSDTESAFLFHRRMQKERRKEDGPRAKHHHIDGMNVERAGYGYILSHARYPGWFKAGQESTRASRVKSGHTMVPAEHSDDVKVVESFFSVDKVKSEDTVHRAYRIGRHHPTLSKRSGREWVYLGEDPAALDKLIADYATACAEVNQLVKAS